ncbi:circularly permutated Ras protein 1 [Patella vulgata]|uniref:circularly permutated Ras protein 1 n=1 Tax=Patella vulgata TaxID=6465 RepID=UPI0021800832|nr:circularly permutated Ras protein 1 [Patella vulgata]XP_050393120.1 circularly permutated Ras protein 1 [Patella vulgata]
MNFASKYVYNGNQDEYEYVSDDEYHAQLSVSDCSSDEEEPQVSQAAASSVKPENEKRKSLFGRMRTSLKLRKKTKKKDLDQKKDVNQIKDVKERRKHHWQRRGDETATAMDQRNVSSQPEGKRRFKKADTNVVSVTLNTLKDPSNMHAGDAVKCGGTGCKAIMSHLSKLTAGMSGKVWVCEFCECNNEVDVEDGEIPAVEDVTFLLEAGLSTEAAGPSSQDESIIVFCIDVSGSMCTSFAVPGRVHLRGSRNRPSFDGSLEDQYLPHQDRNVSHVSSLQAVQAAVDKQLEDLAKDHPNRRVAVIAFNNELLVIGDGTTTKRNIHNDQLDHFKQLEMIGTELPLPKPIKGTQHNLSKKVLKLDASGGTALGPSIVVALGLASRYAGSKIILCTDGLANVGLGKLTYGNSEEHERFYNDIGAMAVEKGVSISVITIKGAETKLVQLGKLADLTNGQVNHVDPLKLTDEFSNILADRIIATNVKATFILHKNLVFLEEDTKEHVIVKNIGNATMETEITFKYGKTGTSDASEKKQEQEECSEGAVATSANQPSTDQSSTDTGATSEKSSTDTGATSDASPTELPFQLQLEYIDTDGTKALRVLTQKRPVTQDRALAEEYLNLEVLGPYAAKACANLALKGEYSQSHGMALMNQRLAWRNTRDTDKHGERKKYNKIFSKIRSVDHHVTSHQRNERSRFGHSYSDSEDDGDLQQCSTSSHRKGRFFKSKKRQQRTDEYTDEMANDVYNIKHMSSNVLLL